MHVTFFHGTLGWAVALTSLWGACQLIGQFSDWLGDRLLLELRPLRLYRRLNRPGTWVQLPDGRYGVIRHIIRDRGVDGVIAAVEPCKDKQFQQAEWIHASELRVLEYEEAA